MNRHKATVLRKHIIRKFQSEGDAFNEQTKKLRVKSMDDWTLTIEDLMELDLDRPDLYFMGQIEKLASILGCSPDDSKLVAVHAYANMVKKGLV